MAITNNVSIITDGLVMCFDAANSRSYTSGNTWTDLTNNSTANVTGITLAGSGGTSHFSFDGTVRALITGVSTWQYGTGPRTVMAWVYPTSTSGYIQILGFGNATSNYASGLCISSGGKWATFQHNTAAYEGSAATANVWTHICMTQSSSGSEIYVNGSLDYSNGTNITTAVGSAYIGASFDDREKWQGRIAQVLFYNKKLTAAEIKQNYNATKRRYGM